MKLISVIGVGRLSVCWLVMDQLLLVFVVVNEGMMCTNLFIVNEMCLNIG